MTKKFLVTLILILSCFSNAFVAYGNINYENEIDSIVNKYIDKDIVGTSIAIVKDGEIIFSKGYGFKNLEKELPVESHSTIFEAGSISKLFTWTALLQLEEQGLINFDDDINDYLGDKLNLKYDEKITIYNLMNHNAGFEENLLSPIFVSETDYTYFNDIPIYNNNQPKQIFEPSEYTAYSNYSTDLAGKIIENVTNTNFENYIVENIFIPLQMNNSSFNIIYDNDSSIKDNKSLGYLKKQQQQQFYILSTPAGGLLTTSEDLAKFIIALIDGDTLFNNSDTKNLYIEQTTNTIDNNMYGISHGFWEKTYNNSKVLEHGGNTSSFTSYVGFKPSDNLGLIVLTNEANEHSGLIYDVKNLVLGNIKINFDSNKDFDTIDKNIQGNYTSTRAVESNIGKLLTSVTNTNMNVKVIDDNNIQLSSVLFDNPINYKRVDNFIFERNEDDTTIYDLSGLDTNYLTFSKTDSTNYKLSFGNIMDYKKVNTFDTFAFPLFLISSLIFVIYFISSLVLNKKITNNESITKKINKRILILSTIGTATIVGNISMFIIFLSNIYAGVTPLLNIQLFYYIYPIYLIYLIVYVIKIILKQSCNHKYLFYTLIFIINCIIYFSLLIYYNVIYLF